MGRVFRRDQALRTRLRSGGSECHPRLRARRPRAPDHLALPDPRSARRRKVQARRLRPSRARPLRSRPRSQRNNAVQRRHPRRRHGRRDPSSHDGRCRHRRPLAGRDGLACLPHRRIAASGAHPGNGPRELDLYRPARRMARRRRLGATSHGASRRHRTPSAGDDAKRIERFRPRRRGDLGLFARATLFRTLAVAQASGRGL